MVESRKAGGLCTTAASPSRPRPTPNPLPTSFAAVVRLHTPHVALADLGSRRNPGSLLTAIAAALKEVREASVAGADARAQAADRNCCGPSPSRRVAAADAALSAKSEAAAQLLRLHACMFRAAVRRAVAAAAGALRSAACAAAPPTDRARAAGRVVRLVEDACEAMEALCSV